MGNKEKATNKVEDLKGRVKEAAGVATGDSDLADEGRSDQHHSAVAGLKESVLDAKEHLKDAVTHQK